MKDVILECTKQLRTSNFKPSAIYMNIKGRVINILDKKHRKKVCKYLKISE